MKKINGLVLAAATMLALAGTSAQADTLWTFTYSGGGVSASGSFETLGNGSTPTLVESVTGTYSDGTTTGSLSLIPTTGTPYSGEAGQSLSIDGLYYYDNLFGGTPLLDDGGLLFSAGGQEVNIYHDANGYESVTSHGGFVTTEVSFSSMPVPEPGSITMLIAGLAALGFVSRRKARL